MDGDVDGVYRVAVVFFFFSSRRRHTRLQGDWSSDVCSSDLPELEQAVKIDPNPDPVNYYLLGMANKMTSHFDDAVAAFNKCAVMTGPMQIGRASCRERV